MIFKLYNKEDIEAVADALELYDVAVLFKSIDNNHYRHTKKEGYYQISENFTHSRCDILCDKSIFAEFKTLMKSRGFELITKKNKGMKR